jgi:hypothetical protein
MITKETRCWDALPLSPALLAERAFPDPPLGAARSAGPNSLPSLKRRRHRGRRDCATRSVTSMPAQCLTIPRGGLVAPSPAASSGRSPCGPVAIDLGKAGISADLGVAEPSQGARNALHLGLCPSVAWLLSRTSGLLLSNLRPRSRPVPKLIRDLVSGMLFLIAIVSGVILMLGHDAGGALAGSGWCRR